MPEIKNGHGRTPRPSPRTLYPAWPADDTATDAHALVQAFVRNLAAYVTEQAGHGVSQSELARRSGVAKATMSKVLRGDVWPDSVTVARFEQVAGHRLWNGPITVMSPDHHSDHADNPKD